MDCRTSRTVGITANMVRGIEVKTTVYVTRHGETEWNVAKRMQGRKNSALTENGILQAKQLGERMKDLSIHAIYSSPSERTLHTAELIKGERDIPIIADEHFYEISMGIWEGQTIDDIERQYPDDIQLFWYEPHLFSQHQEKILRLFIKG